MTEPPINPLNVLIGEQLSSVTFVQNYLQLDFDGRRLTINEWPSVNTQNGEVRFGEPSYRDDLCSLIAKLVARSESNDSAVILLFEDGSSIRVDMDNSRFGQGDRVIFHDSVENTWSWW